MQSHGITLSFHREMADSSRELVGPDGSAAVTFETYPRRMIEAARKEVFWSLPQKEVECLEVPRVSGDFFKLRSQKSAGISRKP
jgi:hypothetical protein